MKFAEIIRAGGFKPKDFPHASEVPIKLYDRKMREIVGPKVSFVQSLFVDNPASFRRFLDYVLKLEKKLKDDPTLSIELEGRLSESALALRRSDSALPEIFYRLEDTRS